MYIGVDNLRLPRSPIPALLLLSTLFCQSADSLLIRTFPLTDKLFHLPPTPFFEDRPYFLELFIDIPWDSLESISIFFRTDSLSQYQAIPLEKYRGRFRFRYDPDRFPGTVLTYFFVATEKNFGLHASPLDTSGRIEPVNIHLVNPVEYYETFEP